jgi:hypothetical protein
MISNVFYLFLQVPCHRTYFYAIDIDSSVAKIVTERHKLGDMRALAESPLHYSGHNLSKTRMCGVYHPKYLLVLMASFRTTRPNVFSMEIKGV